MRATNRFIKTTLFAVALLGVAQRAGAQTDSSGTVLHRYETPTWQHGWQGFGVGAPTGWFLGWGFLRSRDWRGQGGRVVVAEVGTGGARVSVGVGGATYTAGSQLRLSVVRTYGDPWRVPANRTLVGPELRLSLNMFTIGGGAYSIQSRGHNGDRILFAIMFGMTMYPL